MTHTYAVLEVSPKTYREIRDKLEAAGYADQFHSKQVSGEDAEAIDLHGLALKAADEPDTPGPPILPTGSVWLDSGGQRHTLQEYRIRDDGVVEITLCRWEGYEPVQTRHSPGEFCPTPEFPQGFHGYRFVPAGPQ